MKRYLGVDTLSSGPPADCFSKRGAAVVHRSVQHVLYPVKRHGYDVYYLSTERHDGYGSDLTISQKWGNNPILEYCTFSRPSYLLQPTVPGRLDYMAAVTVPGTAPWLHKHHETVDEARLREELSVVDCADDLISRTPGYLGKATLI